MARAVANAAFGPEGEFLTALEAAAETAAWLYEKYPLIEAYLDGLKSLEELQNNVGRPAEGYDVHHIVEKTPARDHKEIRDAQIDGPDNLVSIPRLKHWEIAGWFMTPNEELGWLSPCEYRAIPIAGSPFAIAVVHTQEDRESCKIAQIGIARGR